MDLEPMGTPVIALLLGSFPSLSACAFCALPDVAGLLPGAGIVSHYLGLFTQAIKLCPRIGVSLRAIL